MPSNSTGRKKSLDCRQVKALLAAFLEEGLPLTELWETVVSVRRAADENGHGHQQDVPIRAISGSDGPGDL